MNIKIEENPKTDIGKFTLVLREVPISRMLLILEQLGLSEKLPPLDDFSEVRVHLTKDDEDQEEKEESENA